MKQTSNFSPLQKERLEYQPQLPPIFKNKHFEVVKGKETKFLGNDVESIQKMFQHTFVTNEYELKPTNVEKEYPIQKVGILFSGGPAEGGHNVVWGLFEHLKSKNPQSELYGFKMGPIGLIKGKYIKITEEMIQSYKNQGGFDLLGTGRDKIKLECDYDGCVKSCKDLELTGIVIVGGDDSNTNAAQLAECLKQRNLNINVIGVPKTIDGDLKGNGLEISFGHDTCGKIFSELVGNIATDNQSTKKYYSFIRLMGRDASHITLEVALRTQPNIAFISEEVGAKKKGLKECVSEITDMIKERAKNGKNYGVVLIPEGIVGFIPEFSELINELNIILAKEKIIDHSKISELLKENSRNLFEFLPTEIREELLQERDSHGNVQVSKVETERLFGKLTEKELKKEKNPFAVNLHFFGYEGRCGLPSNFDCDYGFTLGHTAGLLLNQNITGVMCGVRNLTETVEKWEIFGLPLTSLMTIEKRGGVETAVIKKALVDLKSKAFLKFEEERKKWLYEDEYSSPGPIQFYGKSSNDKSRILMLDEQK